MRALAEATEGDRLAGLDAHLPEMDFADLGEHLLDQIVIANRNAAAGDDEIEAAIGPSLACGPRLGPIGEAASFLKQCPQGIGLVAHRTAVDRLGAERANLQQRGEPVGFVDLTGLQGLAGGDQSVAGGDHQQRARRNTSILSIPAVDSNARFQAFSR